MLLTVLYGALVGASLGLTGGGGSILAVPLLVYGLGLDLRRAVALSLAVVGLTALYGAVIQARCGHVLWRAGAVLGAGGIVAAPLGAAMGAALPDEIALVLFATLMVVVGSLMLRSPRQSADVPLEWITCRRDASAGLSFTWKCAAKVAAAGAATGLLSGAFGVGGGFLIFPALVLVLRADVSVALATSLVSIFLIATSALVSNAMHLQAGDWAVGSAFLLGGVVGITAGVRLKSHLPATVLKRVFGAIIIGTALIMLIAGAFRTDETPGSGAKRSTLTLPESQSAYGPGESRRLTG